MRYRLIDFLGFTPLSHPPPLPKRWWAYCAAAHPENQESLQSILKMTRRIRDSINKLVDLTHAPVTEYVEGVAMIDLAKLKGRRSQPSAVNPERNPADG